VAAVVTAAVAAEVDIMSVAALKPEALQVEQAVLFVLCGRVANVRSHQLALVVHNGRFRTLH
jgi:hypothetical protein